MPVIYQFSHAPDPEAVHVRLQLGADLHPYAQVIYPSSADGMRELPRGAMEVHSALATAVFFAGREALKIRVTGDLSIWQERWGELHPDGSEIN